MVNLSDDLRDLFGTTHSTNLLGKAQGMFGRINLQFKSSTSTRRHSAVFPAARLTVQRPRAKIGSLEPDDNERSLVNDRMATENCGKRRSKTTYESHPHHRNIA